MPGTAPMPLWARNLVHEFQRTALTVVIWATLSLSLSYYNSWLLQDAKATKSPDSHPGFSFPMFYTGLQMIAQTAMMSGVFCYVDPEKLPRPSLPQFRAHWKLLVLLAAIRFMQIGGENWALTESSLTFNESVKSLVPFVVMLLAVTFEGRRYAWLLVVAILVLSTGSTLVAIGSTSPDSGDTHTTALGIVLTCTATFAAALTPVCTALLLQEADITVFLLAWYEAALCIPGYILWWLVAEVAQSLAYLRAHPFETAGYVLTGSCMAVCYNLISFQLIKVTSSLTNVVLGSAKHVLMVTVAAVAVDRIHDPLASIGIGFFVPALLAYAFLMLSGLGDRRVRCGAYEDDEQPESGCGSSSSSSSSSRKGVDETTALKAQPAV